MFYFHFFCFSSFAALRFFNAEETFYGSLWLYDPLSHASNASQGHNLPRSAEQIHFLADHNAWLSSAGLWRDATRDDEVPDVLHRIEAVQVVKMKIEESVIAAENVNKSVVDDCEWDNRKIKLINWIWKPTRNLHNLMNPRYRRVLIRNRHQSIFYCRWRAQIVQFKFVKTVLSSFSLNSRIRRNFTPGHDSKNYPKPVYGREEKKKLAHDFLCFIAG